MIVSVDLGPFIGQLSDRKRVELIQLALESIVGEGTIGEIRALVNDPRWNDQPPMEKR